MSDETIYEFDINLEIGITGECMGKLKFAELKKKLKKEIENFFENKCTVAGYDVWQVELNSDYEKQE